MSLLRVRASRSFNSHHAGDELLVPEDDAEVQALVQGGYFELLAVEQPAKPKKAPAKKSTKKKDAADV